MRKLFIIFCLAILNFNTAFANVYLSKENFEKEIKAKIQNKSIDEAYIDSKIHEYESLLTNMNIDNKIDFYRSLLSSLDKVNIDINKNLTKEITNDMFLTGTTAVLLALPFVIIETKKGKFSYGLIAGVALLGKVAFDVYTNNEKSDFLKQKISELHSALLNVIQSLEAERDADRKF